MLLGVSVNAITIVLCGLLGSKIGKYIPEKHSELVMAGIKIIIMVLGISFAINTENILIVIISIVLGSLIGETIDIDGKMKIFSDKITSKLKTEGNSFSVAFVTSSLVFCVGSMAILAAIGSGVEGDHSIHFTKAVVDGIASIFFASTLGIGVAASGVAVFVYQGLLTIMASFIAPYATAQIMTELSATGGIMLIALSFSMLDFMKVKVANMMPALIFPALIIVLFL